MRSTAVTGTSGCASLSKPGKPVLVRDVAQLAFEVVGPAVIAADEGPRAARAARDLHAAMAAGVAEGADLAVGRRAPRPAARRPPRGRRTSPTPAGRRGTERRRRAAQHALDSACSRSGCGSWRPARARPAAPRSVVPFAIWSRTRCATAWSPAPPLSSIPAFMQRSIRHLVGARPYRAPAGLWLLRITAPKSPFEVHDGRRLPPQLSQTVMVVWASGSTSQVGNELLACGARSSL